MVRVMLGCSYHLALNNSSEFHPVGFFDDNKDLQGSSVSGLNVYSVNDIEDLIIKLKVERSANCITECFSFRSIYYY